MMDVDEVSFNSSIAVLRCVPSRRKSANTASVQY